MKNIIVTLGLLLLYPLSILAQKPMKRTELGSDYLVFPVESKTQLLYKYSGVTLAWSKKQKNLLMYGDIDDQNIIFLEKVNFPGTFYPEKFKGCSYAEGKVSLCSQVPDRATVICNIFAWSEGVMKFEKEEKYDLSQLQTDRARDLLKNGKVKEALITYDSVQYADKYFDGTIVAAELLKAGGTTGIELAGRRKFKDAADLIKQILAFKGWQYLQQIKTGTELETKFGKGIGGLTYVQMGEVIANSCKYLVDAKLYDEAIAHNHAYRKFFPQNPDFLLYLADAWYGKKDKEKSKETYQNYLNKMKELKREKQIPTYIEQRMR